LVPAHDFRASLIENVKRCEYVQDVPAAEWIGQKCWDELDRWADDLSDESGGPIGENGNSECSLSEIKRLAGMGEGDVDRGVEVEEPALPELSGVEWPA
jgi:hypothetical protein